MSKSGRKDGPDIKTMDRVVIVIAKSVWLEEGGDVLPPPRTLEYGDTEFLSELSL